MLHIGCHLSSSKGFLAMGRQALELGADTFQFFTRNPRGSKAKELDPADAAALGPAAQALMAVESRCTDLYVLSRPDPAQTGPGQELRSVPVMR